MQRIAAAIRHDIASQTCAEKTVKREIEKQDVLRFNWQRRCLSCEKNGREKLNARFGVKRSKERLGLYNDNVGLNDEIYETQAKNERKH